MEEPWEMDGTACLCPQAASWPHSRWTLWVEAAPVAQVQWEGINQSEPCSKPPWAGDRLSGKGDSEGWCSGEVSITPCSLLWAPDTALRHSLLPVSLQGKVSGLRTGVLGQHSTQEGAFHIPRAGRQVGSNAVIGPGQGWSFLSLVPLPHKGGLT